MFFRLHFKYGGHDHWAALSLRENEFAGIKLKIIQKSKKRNKNIL